MHGGLGDLDTGAGIPVNKSLVQESKGVQVDNNILWSKTKIQLNYNVILNYIVIQISTYDCVCAVELYYESKWLSQTPV